MSIAVLGSINMDLVAEVKRLPAVGETVQAVRMESYPGGKGANQAVAAARLGSTVRMFGKVGDDDTGDVLLERLRSEGVEESCVTRQARCPTGRACIWVGEQGENAIVFGPGANAGINAGYVDAVLPQLEHARLVLLQLEVPISAVKRVLRRLPRPGPTVILDPAPAAPLEELHLARVDILTPNQGELAALTGKRDQGVAAKQMLDQGVGCVICKNGAEGCRMFSNEGAFAVPPFHVDAVDTTAAGDAFNGALAAALLLELELPEAMRWGNAAGALAATRRGAQPSLPRRDELNTVLDGSRWLDARSYCDDAGYPDGTGNTVSR